MACPDRIFIVTRLNAKFVNLQRLRRHVPGGVQPAGGSISRLLGSVRREAADLAYYFNWGRAEIMGMSGRERRAWLGQISRIHGEQRRQRQEEFEEQAERIRAIREQE